MASSSSSTLASSSQSWNHDVFLSFRGQNTRKTFVDHLYSALTQQGIHVYKDDETLHQGQPIGPSLLKAIRESRIAIIVFSKDYADSSWCLDELTYIMKCMDKRGQIVLPVFYDVDPSQVRKQKGKYGEAFVKHELKNIDKVEVWRKALVDAGNLSGWVPKDIANGHESKCIKEIVGTISDTLFSLYSNVNNDLIGMTTRLKDLKSELNLLSSTVRMVGIWGVGGGGKTTLAYSVYMEISHQFEGHCYIENIREESSKHGLKKLQSRLLSAILKTKVVVHSDIEGRCMIKSRLCHKKVLVVLDDVGEFGQLEALVGSHDWFGRGSRIIITTRDKHLLRKVDVIHSVTLLSDAEALQLFHRYAFQKDKIVEDYKRLSQDVVSYASGLPLALKILGSSLYDKDKNEWISALAKMKGIPNIGIMDNLKLSYDGLRPDEKELFLDIACFWRGLKKDKVMNILEACGFHQVIGIKVLIQKGLLSILDDKFQMHDLVRELGLNIVRGEHPKNPEKHSRVWIKEEIDSMCFRNATTKNHNIVAVQYYKSSSHFHQLVANLTNLRMLYVRPIRGDPFEDQYAEGPVFLSDELRFLYWRYYPATPFPESFQPTNLRVLNLPYSFQKELWKGYKYLPSLQEMDLYNASLVRTPDFGGLPCLKTLSLCSCTSLVEIHPSIGRHKSLVYLKIDHCDNLKTFPTIVRMEKLETLKISLCSQLYEFPEIQSNMYSLLNLTLRYTGIKVFPQSVGQHCTKLVTLVLDGWSLHVDQLCLSNGRHLMGFDIAYLSRFLKKLNLGWCYFAYGDIPYEIGALSNLRELGLYGNQFKRLPFSLLELTRLKLLNLAMCANLVELPKLPASIAILIADWCDSLKTVDNFQTNCKWLCQVSLLTGNTVIGGERILRSMLQGNATENESMSLRLEGFVVPKEFIPYLVKGTSFTLQLPPNWNDDFSGFLMCVVLKRSDSSLTSLLKITLKHETCGSECMDSQLEEGVDDEITWVCYVSFGSLTHTRWWDSTYNAVTFSIRCSDGNSSESCRGFGVGLVSRKSKSELMEATTSNLEYFDENEDYAHKFKIRDDSKFALEISHVMWKY